jgi:hypothetical protein
VSLHLLLTRLDLNFRLFSEARKIAILFYRLTLRVYSSNISAVVKSKLVPGVMTCETELPRLLSHDHFSSSDLTLAPSFAPLTTFHQVCYNDLEGWITIKRTRMRQDRLITLITKLQLAHSRHHLQSLAGREQSLLLSAEEF